MTSVAFVADNVFVSIVMDTTSAGGKVNVLASQPSHEQLVMTWTHAVVGCTECSGLWIITPDPDTAICPRCGTRHQTTKLRKLATTTSKTQARELRGRLLAEQHGVDADAIENTSYLTVEPDIDDPTKPTTETTDSAVTLSKPELLEHTIHTLDTPTQETILDAMTAHGLKAEETTTLLEKLRHDGAIIKENDEYRLT